MSLKKYREKRDVTRTGEPEGVQTQDRAPGGTLRFVVQKHRATTVHYDFRLEWNGVLLS